MGGDFLRGNQLNAAATVANFRLDKYEVTVGRFRKFVDAVVSGWRPVAGAGKHTHLNSGQGLRNRSSSAYEPGWDVAWNVDDTIYRIHAAKSSWDSSLACASGGVPATWTPVSGANETRPIGCVNWYQATAFCIWDGGFLPSEAEWHYAAYGGSEQRYYPWSVPPNSTTVDCTYANYDECTPDELFIVGSLPAGDGRFGQSDLGGNAAEWLLDLNYGYLEPCDNCANLDLGSSRARGGGSLVLASSYLAYSSRGYASPETTAPGSGLRCARTP